MEQQPSMRASLRERRLDILRLVEESKVSVVEAESLLRAISEKSNQFIIERYLDRRRMLWQRP